MVGTPARWRSMSQMSMSAVAPTPTMAARTSTRSDSIDAHSVLTVDAMEVRIEVEVNFKSRTFDAHGYCGSRPPHRHRSIGIALLRKARPHRVDRPSGNP